jgi:hypothetical protein
MSVLLWIVVIVLAALRIKAINASGPGLASTIWGISEAIVTSGAPGPIGAGTSSTGQFTNVAIGASVPSLDGTVGDLTLSGSIATGGAEPSGTAGDLTVAEKAAGNKGKIYLGNPANNVTVGTDGFGEVGLNEQLKVFVYYISLGQPKPFSNLPAASGAAGSLAPVSDSVLATWGATVVGGGANSVLAYSDGTNWTVAAS